MFDVSSSSFSSFSLLSPPPKVCVHRHGGPGSAADGLPLSEHQPVCGEFPQDGAKAAGVRQTQPADPRDKLCEFGLVECVFIFVFQVLKLNPGLYLVSQAELSLGAAVPSSLRPPSQNWIVIKKETYLNCLKKCEQIR